MYGYSCHLSAAPLAILVLGTLVVGHIVEGKGEDAGTPSDWS